MSIENLHPLQLSHEQIALRDTALQQISELQGTMQRLRLTTSEQADPEVIADIRSDLNNAVDLLNRWFGTSPIEE